MKSFEKKLVSNIFETIINPSLTKVNSLSVIHPSAVKSGNNIANQIKKTTFVHSSSPQAQQMNHNMNNNTTANVMHTISNTNKQLQNNVTAANKNNGYHPSLPNHIQRDRESRQNAANNIQTAKNIAGEFGIKKPTLVGSIRTGVNIGRNAYSAVLNQLK